MHITPLIKVLRLIATAMATSVVVVLFSQSFASAADPSYKFQWDGNESIIMTGESALFSDYSKSVNETADKKDDDAKGIPFNLETSTSVGSRYVANVNLKHRADVTLGTDVNCSLNRLYLHVDSSQTTARAVELSFSDEDVSSERTGVDYTGRNNCGGDYVRLLGFNAGDTRQGAGFSIGFNNEIEGRRGQNAIIYRFEDQLATMFPREQTHFAQRTCGIRPSQNFSENQSQQAAAEIQTQIKAYRECGQPVRDAYGVIWQQCEYKALQNIYEQSEPMNPREDAGAEQVDSFTSCVKQYSGLGINDDVLKYLTVLDVVNLGNAESCSVRYIGWIVCPLTRFMAKLTDSAFGALQNLFVISPLDDTTDPKSAGYALHRTWNVARNIANLLFTALFLMIIISQVTNIGISNYGIKRLLPKLIVTAILVNASYVLCVLAVDLSNILGSSLHGVFDFLKPSGQRLESWNSVTEKVLVYTVAPTGVGLVLLTGGLIALFPLIIGAICSLLIAVVLIVARYAIILALIVLSPVALACQLLPNTKQWFDKWKSMFISMLMLYPIVSIVYGASTVAALIVINSGFSRPNGEITLQIFGLAIQLLPFALLPILVRFGAPVLGQLSNGLRNSGAMKAINGASDKFIKRRKNARDLAALQHAGGNRRKGIAGLRDHAIQRRYRKKALRDMTTQEYNKAQAQYVARTAQTDSGFANRLARGGGSVDRVIANAIRTEAHLSAESIKANKMSLRERGVSTNDALNMAQDNSLSAEVKQAALEYALDTANPDQFDQIVKRSGNMDAKQRKTVAQSSLSRGGYYGTSQAAQSIMNGESHSQESFSRNIVAVSINSGNFNSSTIGSSTSGNLSEVEAAMNSGLISQEAGAAYSAAAKDAHTNDDLRAKGQATVERDDALRRLGDRTW